VRSDTLIKARLMDRADGEWGYGRCLEMILW
jgi:hypothetical protein